MRQNALLRLLLACFLLYMAWPFLRVQGETLANYFWIGWMVFFVLVAGGNLALLLQLSSPPKFKEPSLEGKKQLSHGKN
ncbi:hypothetical protein ACFFGV_01880 [Pontibacillus salicampi]|uniref:DUF3311 domain-containing protein n=1 Tax=Pontibacillus salicampi TaxID=1449801 RepID=A0ABV6LIV4_9BACI